VQIDAVLGALSEEGIAATDPDSEPGTTPDPGDDYLVSLARAVGAECIVSGDTHLTQLVDARPPILTPREFRVSADSQADVHSAAYASVRRQCRVRLYQANFRTLPTSIAHHEKPLLTRGFLCVKGRSVG
jgi:hypothetical protein